MFWCGNILLLLLMLLLVEPVHCGDSPETFLVVALTLVITGFLVLMMIIYVMLVMQRRSGKVCYVQRSPESLDTVDRNKNNTKGIYEVYDDTFLDSITWARWKRRRYEMRANSSVKSFHSDSNVMTQVDVGDALKNGLKRPSNGTILPVTYLRVLQEEDPDRNTERLPTPVVQEYVCY